MNGVWHLDLELGIVTGVWYTYVLPFISLSWYWRCKKHSCPLSPHFGQALHGANPQNHDPQNDDMKKNSGNMSMFILCHTCQPITFELMFCWCFWGNYLWYESVVEGPSMERKNFNLQCCKPQRCWSAKLHVIQIINKDMEFTIPEDENYKFGKSNCEPHMSYIITRDKIVFMK